jgi:hypothetical protein
MARGRDAKQRGVAVCSSHRPLREDASMLQINPAFAKQALYLPLGFMAAVPVLRSQLRRASSGERRILSSGSVRCRRRSDLPIQGRDDSRRQIRVRSSSSREAGYDHRLSCDSMAVAPTFGTSCGSTREPTSVDTQVEVEVEAVAPKAAGCIPRYSSCPSCHIPVGRSGENL